MTAPCLARCCHEWKPLAKEFTTRFGALSLIEGGVKPTDFDPCVGDGDHPVRVTGAWLRH
ncbi:protein of unknown function [Methylocaldum szegediense]|uniref:Uncharacterized protein n=1 Tax=Methylocaldum szegediense TaxID=73780 RepID=A0ABM9I1F0_9GAMM|nr:protein of unknown function [Methylocaldum szegediense]